MREFQAIREGDEPERGAGVREVSVERIRAAIVSGELLPGQRLPERELCVLTGAARTTVREAIRQLESEGLITTIPYRGPVVSVLTEKEAQEVYEFRAMLEAQAGRLFVQRASDEKVAELRRAVENISRAHIAHDMVGVISNSDEFYHVLTQGAANGPLSQALLTTHNRLALFRFSSTRWPGRVERSMAELRDIAGAIEARDAEAAAAACARHIEAAAELALIILAERARGAAEVSRKRFPHEAGRP